MSYDRHNTILLLSLYKERHNDDTNSQLYESIDRYATRRLAETIGQFRRLIRVTPKPSAVLVLDSAITKLDYLTVLEELITYATQHGGSVICACNFSNGIDHRRAQSFFTRWGLPWDAGCYFRTTVHLNQRCALLKNSRDDEGNAGAEGNSKALEASYSIKSLMLSHVQEHHSIYTPNDTSLIESRVFAPDRFKVLTNETPCAYAPVGKGFFGYVGDVNAEIETSMVILAMLGLSTAYMAQDLRKKQLLEFKNGELRRGEEGAPGGDEKMIVFSDALRDPTGTLWSGARMGQQSEMKSKPCGPPPGVPSMIRKTGDVVEANESMSPPGAMAGPMGGMMSAGSRTNAGGQLENDSSTSTSKGARKKKNAKARQKEQKREKAVLTKEQGNAFFCSGKWSDAVNAYQEAITLGNGLPPATMAVYRSNLAAAYLKLENFLEAVKACDQALRDDVTNIKAYYRRGLARRALGHYDEAMEDFGICQRMAPNDELFIKEIERTKLADCGGCLDFE